MNKLRGEVEIELAGEKWTMRPTFEALSNIEGKLNRSIPEITKAHREGSVRVTEVAVIIWEGLIAANDGKPPLVNKERNGHRLRYEELGNMIVKDGFSKVLGQEAIVLFLLYGLAGELTMEEARKSEEAKDEKDPTKRAE